MRAVSVFKFDDYVLYLKAKISENRSVRGYRETMAKAAGCHRTQISLVLSGRQDFTLEHACGLTELWKLNALEQAYFLALVEFARAGTPALRKAMRARLNQLRNEHENLSVRFETTAIADPERAREYYLCWETAAVHLLVGIDEKTTATQIATRLGLSVSIVEETLSRLEKIGLLRREGSKWKMTERRLHAAKGSVAEILHQSNWRHQAVSRIQRGNPSGVHYTSLYTLSRQDAARLKEKVLDFIQESREIVLPSPPEELVCFSCDFFSV